jgi:hypothetical protein
MAQLKRAGAAVPKKDYVKLVDGFLAGTHSKVGDIVRLTDAQAKYPLLYGWVKLR